MDRNAARVRFVEADVEVAGNDKMRGRMKRQAEPLKRPKDSVGQCDISHEMCVKA